MPTRFTDANVRHWGRSVKSERKAQLYGVAALALVLIMFSIQPGLQSGWHIQPWEERGRSSCTGWRHHWPSWHSCLSSIYHQNYRAGWGMPSRMTVSTITRQWESKWMGEWMDEWMSEWTISWMNECLNAGVSECVRGFTYLFLYLAFSYMQISQNFY